MADQPAARRFPRPARRTVLGVAGALVAAELLAVYALSREFVRSAPAYDPPVLAGQSVPQTCSGGFHARHGSDIVITTSAHCTQEGAVPRTDDGSPLGVAGPAARTDPCPETDRPCAGSDMAYVTLAPDQVPWGHLNEVDLGAGGSHVIAEGTRPLGCPDLAPWAAVRFDGREQYRLGRVAVVTPDNPPPDVRFPCIAVTTIRGHVGDSGGAVLVDGMPAGIAARTFGGFLAFTPLAEGLEELGLELCTTPDCGLVPPVASGPAGPAAASGTP